MRYSRYKRADEGVAVDPDRPVSDSKIVRYQPGGENLDERGPSSQFFMVDGKPMSTKQILDNLKSELGTKEGLKRFKELMESQPFYTPQADASMVREPGMGKITGTSLETPLTSNFAMKQAGKHFTDARRLEQEAADIRRRGGNASEVATQAEVARNKGIAAQGNMGKMYKNTIQGGSDMGQRPPKQDVGRFLQGLSEYR